MPSRLLALPLCAATLAAALAADAEKISGFAPVTVSSANYRTTPREQILNSIEHAPAALNPEAPALQPLRQPQRYVFIRGEVFESDLTYDQVTALLAAALAKKGYLNATDAQGRIFDPDGVALVLRVNYGTRLWRLPTVRSEGLNWDDGMTARPRGMGLHLLGGDQAWDRRAGGNDDALGALATNDAASSGGFSSASSRSAASGADSVGVVAGTGSSALLPDRTGFGSTREFHLIVVDAFDHHELRRKGRDTKRLWTTFISAPRQPKQNFSDVAATLARNAIPYFGETTRGLQIYTDARAEVKIGDLVEVKDEPARP